jgi:ribosomal protein L16 Arg81 hydroxylase
MAAATEADGASSISLATLVAPLEPDEFRRAHWPDTPYWSKGDDDRAALLRSIPQLASAEAVLADALAVRIFRPDGRMAIVPTGTAALPLYRLGLTCYLDTKHIPAVRVIGHRLAADLGLPAGAFDGEVFCSSGASGAWMHSDFDVNLAVLLTGRKRWRIAPNEHIRNQTGMCVASNREVPDPLQLELATRTPFPERMPDDAIELEVGPGGLVFLPRGWWHETESEGECLQVNFVLKNPTWISVLTGAIKDVLVRDPEWRAFAFGIHGTADEQAEARQRLASLLATLPDRLAEVLGADDGAIAAQRLIERSGWRPATIGDEPPAEAT